MNHPPVHVDVVLPDHVWQRLHLHATARGATIAGLLAEAVAQYLARQRTGDPLAAVLRDIDDARHHARNRSA